MTRTVFKSELQGSQLIGPIEKIFKDAVRKYNTQSGTQIRCERIDSLLSRNSGSSVNFELTTPSAGLFGTGLFKNWIGPAQRTTVMLTPLTEAMRHRICAPEDLVKVHGNDVTLYASMDDLQYRVDPTGHLVQMMARAFTKVPKL